jgi:hypothetical protein
VWRYPLDSHQRLDAALQQYRDSFQLIELTSPTKIKAFISYVGDSSR